MHPQRRAFVLIGQGFPYWITRIPIVSQYTGELFSPKSSSSNKGFFTVLNWEHARDSSTQERLLKGKYNKYHVY